MKKRKVQRVKQARLPSGAYEYDLLETLAPYAKKAQAEKMRKKTI
jgi:hypothetical protein